MLTESINVASSSSSNSLTLEEYKRYGRQMILEGFGLPGQLKLKNARVAVVGAGGLGCPAMQYLAGAGVGTIGIFDHDTVEVSNLHRQILHATERVGWYKSDSAKVALEALNPCITIHSNPFPILPSTALSQLKDYTLILDCTDRPQTRYLVSDAAVRLGVTLVSGAAIGWTGQWGVYGGRHQENRDDEAEDKEEGHDTGEWKVDGWLSSTPRMKTNLSAHGQRDTKDDIPKSTRTQTLKAEKLRRPCYRCLWPQPILSSSSRQGAGTCEEEGVLGPTVGLVGVSMAAEAIKVLIGLDEPTPKLTMMNIQGGGVTPFRSVKLRGRRADCVACGDEPKLTDDLEKMDYETFCSGAQAPAKSGASDKVAGKEDPVERISAKQFGEIVSDSKRRSRVLVVDVRQKTEYGIAALPGTINVPMDSFLKSPVEITSSILSHLYGPESLASSETEHGTGAGADEPTDIFFLCRRGNDSLTSAMALRDALSKLAAQAMTENGAGNGDMPATDITKHRRTTRIGRIRDVAGGVRAWSRDVDTTFPTY